MSAHIIIVNDPRDDNTVLLLRFDTMVGDKFADTSGNNLHAWRIGAPTLAEENR